MVVRLAALSAFPLSAVAGQARLYIANQAGSSITVVDQEKLSVDTTIDLTKLGFTANAKPHHVAVEKDGSFWYVSLTGDGRVLKFDRSNKLIGQVSIETPGLLALDPVHDSLYVGRSMTAVNPPKSLGVIRRSSFTMVEEQEIQIPRPHAIVASRDGKWVHTASIAENRIASVETATGQVQLTSLRGVPRSLVQFTVSPDGRWMVAGGELSNTVLVFDLTRPPPFTPASEIAVGGKPWDPVFAPDGKRAYFSLFAGTAVAELDLAAGRITRTFGGHLVNPYDMIMRADGKYLFVVNQNLAATPKPGESGHEAMHGPTGGNGWLSIIDVASGRIEKTLPLGPSPTGMGGPGAR
jgi:DNA-binding beta-propeller fold protein YncE